MRRLLAASIIAAAAAIGPQAPAQPPRDEAFAAALAVIDAAAAEARDLRADFEQRKHTPLLREPIVSTGRVIVKGSRAKWETRRPHESTMTTGGGEIRIHDPERKVVEVYRAPGDLRDLMASPLPRLESLRGRFSIAPAETKSLGLDPSDNLLAIELRPIDPALADHVDVVRVAIDQTIPCIVRMEVTDPDGERTEIRFTDVRINTGVDDDELLLQTPPGTRIIRPLEPDAPAPDAGG